MTARIALSLVAASTITAISSASAGELLLHRVPAADPQPAQAANATVAFVALENAQPQPHAVYVSSGDENTAANLTDSRTSTTFGFSANDTAPTAVIDLGAKTQVQRIATKFSPRGGHVDFFVATTIGDTAPELLRLDDSNLHHVATVTDDGTGRATAKFAATTGRYVVVKWTPAQTDGNLVVAEVAAYGGQGDDQTVAKNNRNTAVDSSDGKTVLDSKQVIESKDVPAEGPQDVPAEGPALGLPQPPPFVFVPELLPVSE
jgi:hypothetical protein